MASVLNPKISIIIPVYNVRKYLRRCLASVCAQTLREIEIICINDGSTDDSLNILNEYADRDNRIIIIDQENAGVANARNRGLQMATAPYIGFVDSDDFIAPDMYEKMYNAMIMNDVDFVECGAEPFFTYFFNNKDSIRDYFSTRGLSGIINNPNVFINTSDGLWKILYKKEEIIKHRLKFMENISIGEDNLFIVSYKSLIQSGFYIPENLYLYFYYENSAIGKTLKRKQGQRVTEVLEIVRLYYLFLTKHNIFEQWRYFFWDYFVRWIDAFYQWAAPEIIRNKGIRIIRELLMIEDISNLVNEKNMAYHKFSILNEEELLDLSFLHKQIEINQIDAENKKQGSEVKRKLTFRKIVKYLLPYGVVRLLQKYV
jgi:glycosyltransferase involved in cell wall biosynthesis